MGWQDVQLGPVLGNGAAGDLHALVGSTLGKLAPDLAVARQAFRQWTVTDTPGETGNAGGAEMMGIVDAVLPSLQGLQVHVGFFQRIAEHAERRDRDVAIADRLDAIDAFLKERYLDSGKLPHVQLLLAHEGKIVHFYSAGKAREEGENAIDEASLFRIASMTKPITSIAFMMLVEQGKVAVDTPVHHVLPEFKGLGVYNGGGGGVPMMFSSTQLPRITGEVRVA